MAVSRRRFIKNGALLGVLAVAPLAAFAGGADYCANSKASAFRLPLELPAVPDTDALAALNQDAFEQHLNSRFELLSVTAAAPIFLHLSGIEDLKSSCGHARTSQITLESFTLHFSRKQTPELPQGTYTLRHSELGTFDLFLVPSADATGYKAVINRLRA